MSLSRNRISPYTESNKVVVENGVLKVIEPNKKENKKEEPITIVETISEPDFDSFISNDIVKEEKKNKGKKNKEAIE